MGYRIYRKQDNFYPVVHWLTSLLVAPFVHYLSLRVLQGAHVSGLLGLFWVYVVYGLFYSLPAFLLYYICFRMLASRFESDLYLKIVFNTGAILCAAVTFYWIDNQVVYNLTATYAVTIILCSLFFKPFIKTVEEIPEP